MTKIEKIKLKLKKQERRSKYANTKWYKLLAYNFPTCYIFYFLETLGIIKYRPWKIDTPEVITFTDVSVDKLLDSLIEIQKLDKDK